MEIETFIINDKNFYPYKECEVDGIKYYLLINVNDKEDVCVRKEIKEDGEIYLSMLDSEEELNKAWKALEID